MASKRVMQKFNKDVVKSVESIWGIKTNPPEKSKPTNITLQTKAGQLEVILHEPNHTPVFSIYCRFESPDLAYQFVPDKYRLNIHSGKYNFHSMSAEECIDNFKSEISQVI